MKKNYIIIGVVAAIAIILGAIAISGSKNSDDNKVINDITVSVNLDGENVGTGTIENNEVVINGSLIGLEDRNYTLAEIDESGFSVGQSNVGTDVVVNIKTDSITDQTDESNVVNNGDDSNIGVNVNDKQNENNGEDSTSTNDGNDKNSENVDSNVGTETGDKTDENGKSTTTEPTKPTESDTKTEQPTKNDGKQGGTGDAKSETKPEGNTSNTGNSGNSGNSSNTGNTSKTETPSETKPETKPETPAKSEDKKDEGNKGTTTEPTKPAEPIKPTEPTKPTEPEKPSKPSNNTTNLLPEKVGTTDFDADANSVIENPEKGMVANLKYSKGMIVSSSKVSRSSSGAEAIKEYVDDMDSAFTSFGVNWVSDSYVKLAKDSAHLSIDDSGKYNAYMRYLNKDTSGTNLWLNFIAYVSSKDVAKAVYGICVERITLGDLNPMSSELVAKYGGTLVSDVQDGNYVHIATISVGGYTVKISYTATTDENWKSAAMDGISSYSVII